MYSRIVASSRPTVDTKYPRPEVLPSVILLPLSIHTRQMNRALALDESHHLRHRVLRRDRDHHVDMVRQQRTFFNPALSLLGQLTEHLAQVLAKTAVQHLPAALRYKYYVVL